MTEQLSPSDANGRALPIDRDRQMFSRISILALALAFGYVFFEVIRPFVQVLVLAGVFAGLTRPVFEWFKRVSGGREKFSAGITLLISLFVVLIPAVVILYLVGEQAASVIINAGSWLEANFDPEASELHIPLPEFLEARREQIAEAIQGIASDIGAFAANMVAGLSKSAAVLFLEGFVLLYAFYYFLLHGSKVYHSFVDLIPTSNDQKKRIVDSGLSTARATIKGTLLIGIMQGVLCGVGFAVAGVNDAVFWGAVMAVLSVIPGIGTSIVFMPFSIYLILTGDIVAGVGLMVWCGVIVGNLDNLIRPSIVGRDTELPDIMIMVSTLGGLSMFGPAGFILGPVVAALFLAILEIYKEQFKDWLANVQPHPEKVAESV